ncbi:MAG: peptidoglycan glycosyltransferase [Opitutus sp.]|nr:peptidoglycan glycosyltransferase [Opitutus sp.]
MPQPSTNLADRTGGLVESHKGYDPRIVFFYFVLAALLLTLAGGLGYQQLSQVGRHNDAERQQNQRRILMPGPRGNIYDRHGKLLVGNNHRFSVLLHLDELKAELRREHISIRKNYLAIGGKDDLPKYSELEQISRVTLVQRYLDQINGILHRAEKVDARALRRHFDRQLLLPYPLLDGLGDEDTARLLERLPVASPLQVYAATTRSYPYGSAAAHTLGYVRSDEEVETEDFPGDDLTTFKMKGSSGRDGLEKAFDSLLQGRAGGRIYRVDPAGYKINPPLESRLPKRGHELVSSLDIDLQLAAEEGLGEQRGAAVAMDVATGEVLVLASKPDYNLNDFSPRATITAVEKMNETGAWNNLALNGFYPPGSTFKILTSIAGLRRGALTPGGPIVNCDGWLQIGGRRAPCYNGIGHHHEVLLPEAIALSCDIYFYSAGILIKPENIAAEARRFRLDQRTGIELPGEQGRMVIPEPAQRARERGEKWFDGDTANLAIGQGEVLVSPLQMACFTASLARNETVTQPTLLHRPDRPTQHGEPIGLSPAQRAALIDGMVDCVSHGTAKHLNTIESYRIPGVQIAGKTGTAQKRVIIDGKLGTINYAWFICFAPAEKPEIAMAVMIEGQTIGEELGGGLAAAPVAAQVLKKYFEKRNNPTRPMMAPLKVQ